MLFIDQNDTPFSFWSRVSVKVWQDYIMGTIVPSYEIKLDRPTDKWVSTAWMRSIWAKQFIKVASHPNGNISSSNNL